VRECTIHRNSYKQADSWEVAFAADDFPIDPQLIRTVAVEIYMYQTDEVADDIAGRPPKAVRSASESLALEWLKSAIDSLRPSPQIAGLADDVTVEYTTSGNTVRITGQDYTAYLIEKQWPPLANGKPQRIQVNKRIDVLMREWLKKADPTGRLRLSVRGIDESELPVVSESTVRGNQRGIPVQTDTSYWDVLYSVATRSGLICFVLGLDVVLTRPQVFSAEYKTRPLRLTWGRNIETLEMSRSLGKEKVPQIIMKGYDPKTKAQVSVEYPEGKLTAPPPGTLGANSDEFIVYPVFGVTDKNVLRNMAEGIFHLLGRAERTVRLITKDLKDAPDSDGNINDLLNAAAGTPCIIDFDEFNVNEALLSDPKVNAGRKFDHLKAKGYSDSVAQTLATGYTKLQALKRPMRIRELTFSFSQDSGISIEAELVDYVVVDGARKPENKTA
jgi:hypothetical protein